MDVTRLIDSLLLGAMSTVHLQFGFASIKLMAVTTERPGPPGYETDLLHVATLVMAGCGPLTVDDWIARRLGRRP